VPACGVDFFVKDKISGAIYATCQHALLYYITKASNTSNPKTREEEREKSYYKRKKGTK
jgi:hypothetical protein